MSNQGNLSRRLSLFAFLLVALVGALGIRLVDFQVVRADEISRQSLESRSVTQTLTALRGEIRDSSGQVLARTVFRYDVNAAPKNVGPVVTRTDGVRVERSVLDVSLELAAVLGISLEDLTSKLQGDSEYSNLAKKVDGRTFNAIRDLAIPWIYFDKFADRLYPDGAVGGNLMGFVGSDGTPLAGLERQYNSCLAGIDGQETFERSREGVRIPTSNQTTQPTQHGGTLNLSIDANLQFFAQQVLSNAVSKLSAEWATAIVLEVETGRILAAAEAPTVDPNKPGATDALDRGSRIFQTAFEPGSIMKSITSAIVLDTGKANELDTVISPDFMTLDFAGGSIKDSFAHEDYNLTLAGVLRYSSNTGMSKFGIKVDSQTRYDYLKRFGFGTATPLRFQGESSGILHPANEWDKMTDYATLFGQGISVTTMQMASAYQAIANDGVRLSPILVDSCVKQDGTLYAATPQESVQVIKKSTANLNLELMEKVVEYGGVGKNAQIDGYRVAGKTGTAQVQDGLGGYGERYAISFYGVAPVDNPKFVVGISIFRPLGETNSLQATPPFVAIMQQALKQYRIPPSTTSSRDIPSDKTGR